MTHFKDPRPSNKKERIARFRLQLPPEAPSGSDGPTTIPAGRLSTMGLEPYEGTWGEEQIVHLLKRTLFGVKKSELELYKTKTMEEAVDSLLAVSVVPLPPVNDYNGLDDGVEDDPDIQEGETWVEAPYNGDFEGLRTVSLKGWWINNILNQEATINEKMVLFWHNLLPIQTWEVFTGKASYQYVEMLRSNSLGNYKTLIKELTLNPAMLFFLNGTFNHKDAPDENYGRELQELFCIGKGEEANFTEGDVQAAARVLTGWVIDYESIENNAIPTSFFWPDIHDTEDKQFSAFYNNTEIIGKTGTEGANELDEMLEMIFSTNEIALYIARRIYNFFVASTIDATVEENMIQPMADLFRNSNYEIAPVLQALFKSAHFYDTLTMGVSIKNPADQLLGVWRTLNIPLPAGKTLQTYLQLRSTLLWTMTSMGMEIGDPPNVSGWSAYYQAPQYDRAWITTNTITLRAAITDAIVSGYVWVNDDLLVGADLISFLEGLNDPGVADKMLEESTQLLLGIPATEDMIITLKEILLSGQSTDNYWTYAWNDYRNEPSNTEYIQILENRLKPTFQYILQLAEQQLT